MANKEFEEWLEAVKEKIRGKLERDGYITTAELLDIFRGGTGDCYRIPGEDQYGWIYKVEQNKNEEAL